MTALADFQVPEGYRPADCHPDRRHYAHGQCKSCYSRVWWAAHVGAALQLAHARRSIPEKMAKDQRVRRARDLRLRFGLSMAQYEELRLAQDGRCAICGTDQPGGRWGTFAVDHDHLTGRVRGLLCFRCNRAMGLLQDDAGIASAIAVYLAAQ